MLHRHARPAVAGAYLSGAIGGALMSASALLVLSGFFSPLPLAARQAVAVAAVSLLLLRALGLVCVPLPHRRYQIPRETFGNRPARSAFRFAGELGLGFRTYVTSSSPYALVVVLLLCLPDQLGPSAAAATAAAVGFGVGRSVVVASQAMRRRIAVDHPPRWLRAGDVIAALMALAIALGGL